jgi:hypothetical protein
MRNRRVSMVMVSRCRTYVVAASVGALAAFLAVAHPTPVRATHPSAGNCPHVHDFVDDTFSICTEKSTGKKCKRDDVEGTCKPSVIDSDPPFPRRGTECLCVSESDERQALQLVRMHEATMAAIKFPNVYPVIGTTLACSQLATQINDILLAKSGVLGHGPIRFYDERLLGKVDFVISKYPTLHSHAMSCSLTGLPALTDVLNGLAAIKSQINASFSYRFK